MYSDGSSFPIYQTRVVPSFASRLLGGGGGAGVQRWTFYFQMLYSASELCPLPILQHQVLQDLQKPPPPNFLVSPFSKIVVKWKLTHMTVSGGNKEQQWLLLSCCALGFPCRTDFRFRPLFSNGSDFIGLVRTWHILILAPLQHPVSTKGIHLMPAAVTDFSIIKKQP